MLKFALCSKESSIRTVEDIVSQIMKEYHVSSEKCGDILVSLTEAVNNAIRHGNRLDETKKVLIECKEEDGYLSFIIADEGNGFCPEEVPNPTKSKSINQLGGRGVFLMKELSDKIYFHQNGSCVEMKFTLVK